MNTVYYSTRAANRRGYLRLVGDIRRLSRESWRQGADEEYHCIGYVICHTMLLTDEQRVRLSARLERLLGCGRI